MNESRAGVTRLPGTRATIVQLLELGYDVIVESGAGSSSCSGTIRASHRVSVSETKFMQPNPAPKTDQITTVGRDI